MEPFLPSLLTHFTLLKAVAMPFAGLYVWLAISEQVLQCD